MTYRSKKTVYQIVTDRIIDNVSGDPIQWIKGWRPAVTGDGHMETPMYNAFTGYCYNLMNCLMLKHKGGYATLKQLKDHGAHIVDDNGKPVDWPDGNRWPKIAWEKDMVELVATYFRYKDVDDDGNVITDDDGNVKTHTAMSYYYVISTKYTDLPEKERKKTVRHFASSMTRDEQAEAIIKGYYGKPDAPKLAYGGNKAYYSPANDSVHVPTREQFGKKMAEFYSTVFHETGHSTGAENRLNRKIRNLFGSEQYAKEELVAELTAAMLCSACGIETDASMSNSTAYIQGWKTEAGKDPHLLERACSLAEKAFCYIMDRVPEYNMAEEPKPEAPKAKPKKRTRKPKTEKPEVKPEPKPVAVPAVVVEPKKVTPENWNLKKYYPDAFYEGDMMHIEGDTPEGSHVWFNISACGLLTKLSTADFKKAWKTLSPYMTEAQKNAMYEIATNKDMIGFKKSWLDRAAVMRPTKKNRAYADAVREVVNSMRRNKSLRGILVARKGDTLYTTDTYMCLRSKWSDYKTLRAMYSYLPEDIEDGKMIDFWTKTKYADEPKDGANIAKLIDDLMKLETPIKATRETVVDTDVLNNIVRFKTDRFGEICLNADFAKFVKKLGDPQFYGDDKKIIVRASADDIECVGFPAFVRYSQAA